MNNLSLYSLTSGSSGNSFLIKYNDDIIIIDAGLSCIRFEKSINSLNYKIEQIAGLIITHNHSDHISGLGQIARKHNLPIYISKICYDSIKDKIGKIEKINFINEEFNIKNFEIESIKSSHDSVEMLNFIIKVNNTKISFITDTGYVHQYLFFKIKDTDILIIEANYDKNIIIENDARPWFVKQRVLSRNGHLSNDDCLEIINKINIDRLKYLFLIHISKDHNDYKLVENFFNEKIKNNLKKDIEIIVCKENEINGLDINEEN
ncbi:MAG TPA: MBL fold metallo-hydrolase [bacterium]|nr:MBL fold metallo-hydrolase [bacterium]HOL48030.1 MBL fold metallo-hydrolase [bacterium]HPQ19138.1 MBL fold metallo-hydrolase [bacterium]